MNEPFVQPTNAYLLLVLSPFEVLLKSLGYEYGWQVGTTLFVLSPYEVL